MANNGESISFSKDGIKAASGSFSEIGAGIALEIDKIKADLETIDTNWTGPEHDSASTDKTNAESNLQKSKEIIASMDGALIKLASNAKKVSYNG